MRLRRRRRWHGRHDEIFLIYLLSSMRAHASEKSEALWLFLYEHLVFYFFFYYQVYFYIMLIRNMFACVCNVYTKEDEHNQHSVCVVPTNNKPISFGLYACE